MSHVFSRTLNYLLLATWFASAAASFAQTTSPAQVKALYKIYKSGILIGTVDEQFTRTGDSYRIVSTTTTAGALAWLLRDRLTITSEGRISSDGLEPARYDFRRDKDQSKDLSARFDWSRSQIISEHDDKTENFNLPPGTLDRVSAMYQFMFKAPTTSEVKLWMSQGKKAEQYRYRRQDEPLITTGDTQYSTVHYARETQPGESRAQLWLAKDKNFIPVRMVFEDSHGISLEQSLVSLDIRVD